MKVGPRMETIISYVARNPGLSKAVVARACGPKGSRRYGYQAIERCLNAGLLEERPDGRFCRLFVPQSALEQLAAVGEEIRDD